jgi:hypothetical protein
VNDHRLRMCLRAWSRHTTDSAFCDCLRVELPVNARALSSGALGSSERNHTCPACKGKGAMAVEGIGAACCPRCAGCAGCGERKASREPADHAFPGGGK